MYRGTSESLMTLAPLGHHHISAIAPREKNHYKNGDESAITLYKY